MPNDTRLRRIEAPAGDGGQAELLRDRHQALEKVLYESIVFPSTASNNYCTGAFSIIHKDRSMKGEQGGNPSCVAMENASALIQSLQQHARPRIPGHRMAARNWRPGPQAPRVAE